VEINEIISSGLLESYAMGHCTEEENLQVQQWVQKYPEVAVELASIERSLEDYASAHALPASGSVKKNLFDQLGLDQSDAPVAKTISIGSRWKWLAAASIILFLASSVINFVLYNQYKKADDALASTTEALHTSLSQNKQMENDGKIISDPNSIPVSLKGLEAMPDAVAKIFWLQNSGDVFIDATSLPDAPEGKQYQFWAIVGGVPVNGGLILKTNKASFHLQRMKSFGKAEAFAISLEKEGGSPTPTKVVSMGKII
jgi:anti-sigma-K factor RskA